MADHFLQADRIRGVDQSADTRDSDAAEAQLERILRRPRVRMQIVGIKACHEFFSFEPKLIV